jgi:phospho-N-acetylmuramoyl-pentapeptide-transferase
MILEFIKLFDLKLNFLNVFNYISFRSVLAIITSLGFSLFFGSIFIKLMGDYSFSQFVREVRSRSSKKKWYANYGRPVDNYFNNFISHFVV